MLSALVPIVATLVLSLGQVQRFLGEQDHARLAQTSEGYAASLYARLLSADERARDVAARFDVDGAPADAELQRLRRQFNAMGVADRGGRVSALFGELSPSSTPGAQHAERQARDGAVLAAGPNFRGAAPVNLARSLDSGRRQGRTLVAEIDSLYLWGEPSSLPVTTGVCVVDDAGAKLFCSNEAGPEAVRAFAGRSRGTTSGSFSFNRAEAVKAYLAPVARLGATSFFVLPNVWQKAMVGAVVRGSMVLRPSPTTNAEGCETWATASASPSRPRPRTNSSTTRRTTTR